MKTTLTAPKHQNSLEQSSLSLGRLLVRLTRVAVPSTDCLGIGQTTARLFALNGCQKLFLSDLSRSKLERTISLIERDGNHPQIELYEGSVSDVASVRGMIDRCAEVFGRIDVACNNAGVSSRGGRTHEAMVEDFDFTCSVNERGVSLSSISGHG
jgi:NAD(P)-dependent dehydrogenase (short-subunit alcohol dehydrogenase family)